VLVVVAFVGGMVVPVMNVVHVVAVAHGVVPTAGFVSVLVFVVGRVRQRVLVVMTLMRRVRVTIVHVVGMSVMPDASVPAVRTVLVRVLGMNGVRVGRHRSPVIVEWVDAGHRRLRILPTGGARQTTSSPRIKYAALPAGNCAQRASDLDKHHRNSPGKP
jgi:hypothetical protein